MRGKGGLTFLSFETSRSSTVASSCSCFSSTLPTTEETNCSISSMSPSRSMKATSGSTIQNSVRWRRVFDFSARKVGPKQ